MQNRVTKTLLKNSFWLSVLLHLLLLLSLLSLITLQPTQEKKQALPHYFVPAYTYTGSIKPAAQKQQTQSTLQSKSVQTEPPKTISKIINKADNTETNENIQSVQHSRSILSVPKVIKKISTSKNKNNTLQKKSLLAASFDMLKDDQMRDISKKREVEPIYLIGDDNAPADPLIKLMGRSLSAHFHYPHVAGELGIRGRVIVELTLHPEGYYSDVKMVKSSDNQDLDAAALYAVNSAPTVEGAERFISSPKHFVVGFVFN